MSITLANSQLIIPAPLEAQFDDSWGVNLNAWFVFSDAEHALKTFNMSFADFTLSRPLLSDYAEKIEEQIAISSGVAVIDFENGNHAEINMSENVTTLTISNPPATGKVGMIMIDLKQSGVGSFTVVWPGTVDWGADGEPTLSTASGSTDTVTLRTKDGGTTYQGFVGRLGFTTV